MKTIKTGGCHCGKIRFKATADFSKAIVCNCSICTMKGFLHVIVDNKNDFSLVAGEKDLGVYEFGTRTAKHLFCKSCGISSFYIPRSHPNGYSVNIRCIDEVNLSQVQFQDFDGENWEGNIHSLK